MYNVHCRVVFIYMYMYSFVVPVNKNRPELKDLQYLAVPDWEGLGLQLGLSEDQLKVIKADNPQNIRAQRREMFSSWLKTSPDPSYEELIRALRMDEDNFLLADELTAKHLQK